MKAIALPVCLAAVFLTGLNADDETAVPSTPTGVRYTLADGESIVVSMKGWSIGTKDEENLIGWISSDAGRKHTHRIYRLGKDEIQGKTGQDHAAAIYKALTEGDEILFVTEWKIGDSQGGKSSRKIAHLKSDVTGDDTKEDVWLIVESKEFDDRVYLQIVYHEAPLEKAKLDVIDKVLNSVQPKPKNKEDAVGRRE
ncbi:MAG: hypothetical protein KDK97_06250 [Verrucomicrobiales bacterium]|nr:hypothetical protein [Verrucomicrobiales bacterium]MCP5558491.1 hypothetical protein [Verrucomicrobiaceae bacterium]